MVGDAFCLLDMCTSATLLRMKRITLYMTEQQITALQRLSRETGLKFAELMRRMVDEGIVRMQGRQPRPGHEER